METAKTREASAKKPISATSSSHGASAASAMREQAARFLATGASHKQVALALGVTEARVSQLADDEDVKRLVSEMAMAANEEEIAYAQSYKDLEKSILAHIAGNLAMATFTESVKALDVVHGIRVGAKQAQQLRDAMNMNPGVSLNLTLTPHATEKLVVTSSENREILTIADKPMVSMPSDSVESMMIKQTKELKEKEMIDD